MKKVNLDIFGKKYNLELPKKEIFRDLGHVILFNLLNETIDVKSTNNSNINYTFTGRDIHELLRRHILLAKKGEFYVDTTISVYWGESNIKLFIPSQEEFKKFDESFEDIETIVNIYGEILPLRKYTKLLQLSNLEDHALYGIKLEDAYKLLTVEERKLFDEILELKSIDYYIQEYLKNKSNKIQ